MLSSPSVIPAHAILPGVLTQLIRKAPLTADKVEFAWRTAVGPVVARATTVVLEGRTLRVQTDNPAWLREVQRSASLIRNRLDGMLGAGVVTWIEIASHTDRL
jgi:hypothetical protein